MCLGLRSRASNFDWCGFAKCQRAIPKAWSWVWYFLKNHCHKNCTIFQKETQHSINSSWVGKCLCQSDVSRPFIISVGNVTLFLFLINVWVKLISFKGELETIIKTLYKQTFQTKYSLCDTRLTTLCIRVYK